MKMLLLAMLAFNVFVGSTQINYTVDVLRLKALADDCDGGAPFCINAPQDPIFNMWVTDGGGNENTYCWIYEDDPLAEYGLWIDIQNLQIANETNVITSYISIEMSGFETDALFSASCTNNSGDDAVEDRQLAQQFDLSTIPMSTPYVTTVDIAGIYFAEIQIEWIDPSAGISEMKTFVKTYPNPANESVTFSISNMDNYHANLTDLSGRTIISSTISNGTVLDVSILQRGTYILQVFNDAGILMSNEKLILNNR